MRHTAAGLDVQCTMVVLLKMTSSAGRNSILLSQGIKETKKAVVRGRVVDHPLG